MFLCIQSDSGNGEVSSGTSVGVRCPWAPLGQDANSPVLIPKMAEITVGRKGSRQKQPGGDQELCFSRQQGSCLRMKCLCRYSPCSLQNSQLPQPPPTSAPSLWRGSPAPGKLGTEASLQIQEIPRDIQVCTWLGGGGEGKKKKPPSFQRMKRLPPPSPPFLFNDGISIRETA